MRTANLIQHSAPAIGDEEIEAVTRVMRSGRIAQGPEVEAFEEECAALVGRKHAVAVSSGTAALHLALNALGVDKDTRVAIPAYACASLLTAVSLQDARAELCDIDDDYNLDHGTMPGGANVTILPHLFGKAASVPDATTVIEDIAQSIGGNTGAATPVAIASFYATKLVTAAEGGMVLTDDADLAEHVRDRRDYDNRDDFIQRFSYKLNDIQAAIGRVQLRRLPEFIDRRKGIAFKFLEGLHDLPIDLPDPENHIFFRFVIRLDEREALQAHLAERGIEAKRPVYKPAHEYFAGRGNDRVSIPGGLLGCDRAHRCALSLPIHPNMLDQDVDHVINCVRQFC